MPDSATYLTTLSKDLGQCFSLEEIWTFCLNLNIDHKSLSNKDYETVPALFAGLGGYFHLYNYERPHQSLDYRTPAAVHELVF